MQVIINDKPITFPSSLSDVTLGQRIDFHKEHGNLLEKMLESIGKIEDQDLKEIELLGFQFERMFRTFAFFAGTSVEAIKESEFIDQVAQIYNTSLAMIFNEEAGMEQKNEFEFKGTTWYLHPAELKPGDKMKFGEVIEAKQIVKDMLDLGHGRWEAALRLCAIYLRKKDEEFSEEFLYDDSERMKLMRELPMDIALQVGFFLKNSLSLYQGILMSSKRAGQNHPATL
jgi:hypothetical protein